MSQAQIKRIMISLPDSLLAEVDDIVEAESVNRSEFIREAMRLYIAERKRRILREQMKKGYLEMAKLNLALAIEYQRMENVNLGYELAKAEG
ncbi:CopG family ribbon-helix-helix protein [Desulforamulus aquiferis]|uniref:Ribbon-helix-helix protein, CopG family n=1 Tax=Desulforamulus aquiferis TaxID=1397668 RepID=A0AAW7Z896_9FIRM|nr:ribbon-helix-helix protein, CopG family [Desulforamulus aquiferis]MDO7785647.1 ribbon-helix-helix protein, CopG family [Desulforamulus aquiferis]RYD03238.1 CopG family transcriptional regulator [Desulforamulus aquiferis]